MRPADDGVDGRAWRLLAALTALHVLSYADRLLLAALAPLIMADLGLNRAQVGLLVGTAFVVVFALMMPVLGAVADRVRRPRLIAGGLAVWSASTALSGAALGFSSLAATRAAVGVGEATLVPAAVSILGNAFPRSRLGLASGIFYAAIPVGFGLSFAVAGFMGLRLGWRACFWALGLLGLAAVPLAAALPDPRRPEAGGQAPAPGVAEAARVLVRHLRACPEYGLVCLAGAGLSYMSSASQHTITWLVQERGLSYPSAALLSAVILCAGGLVGTVALGVAADRAQRHHPAGRLWAVVAWGALSLPAAVAFYLLPPSSPAFLATWFLAQSFTLGWVGPLLAAVHELSPPGLRATGVGFGLLVTNLLGVATGPWVTGLIGDRAGLTRGLLASLVVGGVALALLAAVAAPRRGPVRPQQEKPSA